MSKNRKSMEILKNSMGIEDLCIRRKCSLLNHMFVESKNLINIQIKDMSMSLRSSKKLTLKSDFTRLTKIQRSPYYRGLQLWNSLPEDTQNEQNRIRFKASVMILFR